MHSVPREEEPGHAPATAAQPVVVTQGLTYRDLQRAIFLMWGLFLIWQMAGPITTLLLFFLLVFILAAVLNPVVVRLQERGMPRIAGALLMAGLFLAALGLIGWLAFPPLFREISTFASNLDEKQAQITETYQKFIQDHPQIGSSLPAPQELAQNLSPNVGRLLGQVGRTTMNIAVGVMSIFLLMVLVIYTVAHPSPLITGLLAMSPERYRPRVESALRRILDQLKNWAFGSLVLGVIVGVMTGIGLWLLSRLTGKEVPYILLFSVIAGVGELVPNIGPVLSAIPPTLVALTIDPMLALWVLLLFAIIQQAENNLIVPMVMGQSLNLHPVSLTFMVLVMGALFGLLGAVLAVPVCAIVKVCWEEFYLIPREANVEHLQDLAADIVSDQEGHPKTGSSSEQPGQSDVPGGNDDVDAAADK
jgi:putative permease